MTFPTLGTLIVGNALRSVPNLRPSLGFVAVRWLMLFADQPLGIATV